jgi:acyl-CoA synthetase (AMP-forming)/AMP-acid ligase II
VASRDLSSWRLCTLGGAPVAPELVRRVTERLGVKVAIGYGQTEASPYVTHTLPDDPHPDWISTIDGPFHRPRYGSPTRVAGRSCRWARWARSRSEAMA